ncbi:hydrogenase expression protein HupH [Bosea caraganae]|uniref:Hydrogenase expression protein HupH n=1 Tax=Bosea caraganae TaxID=2763117 RepID=A0A370L1Z9_9HYPH|nr:aspartate/glutamate racemase family protein [Bosea caraganae]RDJ21422.1 hydrogenase expression protein HupH [Bosea caraganae]RDJ23390.1 hydrogenase expression protein HupH [Bosea caraganae]
MTERDLRSQAASRLVLINPNTNAATTEAMRAIAQEAAPDGVVVEGLTAPHGAPLITHAQALAVAGEAVLALAEGIAAAPPAGVIVSAFGDPGLEALRRRLPCPVTGIAEAAMLEAAAGGRSFAVVTTTPDLVASIEAMAIAYGHGPRFRGVALTKGDVHAVMSDPQRLVDALAEACGEAIDRWQAQALVIGGGPLAQAAKALSGRFGVPVVAPIPAAVRLALLRQVK